MVLVPISLVEQIKGLHQVAIYYEAGRRMAIQYKVNQKGLKKVKEIFKNLMKEVKNGK